jgi:hypothetical protein
MGVSCVLLSAEHALDLGSGNHHLAETGDSFETALLYLPVNPGAIPSEFLCGFIEVEGDSIQLCFA